ncbi:MAG: dephospho-CoA kinase [Bacteroidota bacterium]
MKTLGITGGIGSGKTIVCEVFSKLNIPVFNADNVSKSLLNTSGIIKKQLINNFGRDIYDNNNQLNKSKLSDIIFANKEKLQLVNSIVHPIVIENFNVWKTNYSGCSFVIIESAILFENKLKNLTDKNLLVYSSEETRIKRIVKRDNLSRKKIQTIMKNQLSDDIKKNKADIIIYNNDNDMIIPQILDVYNELNRLWQN